VCVRVMYVCVSNTCGFYMCVLRERRDVLGRRGGGLGSRPKKMYGERLGNGVEYHLMSPTPRR